ncbi:hypothetical protein HGRIS_009671 [Hohenbuehelia grisea]|uniref:Golgi apparatus membrane protein TVP38 n=1 Tax=Hohenbuehelia grisea TaxID=104357 RepID=A0ABR3J264_9AGAR
MAHRSLPTANRPPGLHLLSESAPARPVSTSPPPHQPSQSPFRYVHRFDEKSKDATALVDLRSSPPQHPYEAPSASRYHQLNVPAQSPRMHHGPPGSPHYPSRALSPSPFLHQSAPLHLPISPRPSPYAHLVPLLRPWLPLILYAISSLGFVVAIAFYRDELFAGLDELSVWLRADPQFGHAVLFSLIFLTTIPPFPLYSTLIILSGYTFGPWTGAVISYFAALSGALAVFIVSRTLLRESIARWLDSACTIKRVVRAIEKRPTLLFLIRLAPYPYNVMNCLLAAAPALTLRTYTVCTALSLFKVIIHTGIGASIHSFREYHAPSSESAVDDGHASSVARTTTVIGVGLCIAIFVYLSIVARRAVDEELGDEGVDEEETLAFLPPHRSHADDLESGAAMVESPFRATHLVTHPPRAPLPVEPGGRWA